MKILINYLPYLPYPTLPIYLINKPNMFPPFHNEIQLITHHQTGPL
jgi:hypothetical protein